MNYSYPIRLDLSMVARQGYLTQLAVAVEVSVVAACRAQVQVAMATMDAAPIAATEDR